MKKKNTLLKNMERILVILPNNLGDVIMTLPVLEGLKEKFIDCYISFFVEDGFEGGLENFKFCDKIIRFNRKKIRDLLKTDEWNQGVSNLKDTVDDLRRKNYDQIINLSQISYISYLIALVNNSKHIGQVFLKEGNHSINNRWTSYLYAIPFARKYNSLHTTDIYKRISNVSDVFVNTGINVSDEEKEKMKTYLNNKNSGLKNRLAIFHPGAAYDSKRWPIESYIQLGKRIVEDGFSIIITGAESERNIAQAIKDQVGRHCLVTSGELSFRQSLVLLSFSEYCVTSDTAMMHAAASLSKKVFALFGPTSPVETGPYSSGNIIFSGRCVNRPCFCIKCSNKICMKSILPDTVYSYIKNVPDLKATCDVYSTSFVNGIYQILPVLENGNPYYCETGASVNRKSLEKELFVDTRTDQYELIKLASLNFIKTVAEMKQHLGSFLSSGSRDFITEYEMSRKNLVDEKGITEFWAAMLNMDLNSIPLIDPLYGIKESMVACDRITNQIRSALMI